MHYSKDEIINDLQAKLEMEKRVNKEQKQVLAEYKSVIKSQECLIETQGNIIDEYAKKIGRLETTLEYRDKKI
jgi:hypothetical protein